MATISRKPAPDYTGRDYDTALVRLQRLVQSVYPKWTDFNRVNFGNMLLRCMAFIVDVISYICDFWARESLPSHARLRRSIQAHVQWIGYELTARYAAQATVQFVIDSAHVRDILIPAGTIVRAPSASLDVDFQVLSDTTLVAGDTEVDVLVEHSEWAQDIEESTGRPNQTYRLSQEPYIQDSMEVIAADGTYTKVANFLQSSDSDKHFMVETDDDERPIVSFGNGVSGKVPVGDIEMNYKVGGGDEGNLESGSIEEIVDEIFDISLESVDISVVQPTDAQGGENRETLQHAKETAAAELTVLNRTVTREDFEIQAENVGGVARCLFLTADETVLIPENEGVGWLVGKGTVLASGKYPPDYPIQEIIDNVESAWISDKPKMLTFKPRAVGISSLASYLLPVDIYVTVYLDDEAVITPPSPGGNSQIGIDIWDNLTDFFAVEDEDGTKTDTVDFGYNMKRRNGTPIPELVWSDIFNVIRDTAGVRKVEYDDLLLNGEPDSVALKFWEFPTLGTVTIIDGDTGSTLYV